MIALDDLETEFNFEGSWSGLQPLLDRTRHEPPHARVARQRAFDRLFDPATRASDAGDRIDR